MPNAQWMTETIERLKKPSSIPELQRLLGMINYLSKFIPRAAERSAPMPKLLEKDVTWRWKLEQENAFEDLKESLNSHSVASVLLQECHPVFYASEALAKTQQNYSQIEKEAFAILSACTKFHEYIWGNQETINHWIHFEILPYNPTIRYKKGSELYIADTSSYDCHDIPGPDTRAVYEIQVVISMSAQLIAQLKDAIHTSTEQSALCRTILKDNLCNNWTFRDELAVYEDIISKGKRTIIPPSWKSLILSQLHCSHKGVQGTLEIARDHVFWLGMTQDIISYVQNCAICQKHQNDPSQEALSEETVPLMTWMYVAFDLFHYKGKKTFFLSRTLTLILITTS
ncbi:hypothetical protein PR048_008517 [Dryococelus australis]|uniref:RNA-directed DNA polymerase n=1 Tax=Dryococelus australis TaxID=614101 RepID=A0ABQ9HXC3_9NEOP|nr:hypothetical protein PR048_008517 [Dryococelus australis]